MNLTDGSAQGTRRFRIRHGGYPFGQQRDRYSVGRALSKHDISQLYTTSTAFGTVHGIRIHSKVLRQTDILNSWKEHGASDFTTGSRRQLHYFILRNTLLLSEHAIGANSPSDDGLVIRASICLSPMPIDDFDFVRTIQFRGLSDLGYPKHVHLWSSDGSYMLEFEDESSAFSFTLLLQSEVSSSALQSLQIQQLRKNNVQISEDVFEDPIIHVPFVVGERHQFEIADQSYSTSALRLVNESVMSRPSKLRGKHVSLEDAGIALPTPLSLANAPSLHHQTVFDLALTAYVPTSTHQLLRPILFSQRSIKNIELWEQKKRPNTALNASYSNFLYCLHCIQLFGHFATLSTLELSKTHNVTDASKLIRIPFPFLSPSNQSNAFIAFFLAKHIVRVFLTPSSPLTLVNVCVPYAESHFASTTLRYLASRASFQSSCNDRSFSAFDQRDYPTPPTAHIGATGSPPPPILLPTFFSRIAAHIIDAILHSHLLPYAVDLAAKSMPHASGASASTSAYKTPTNSRSNTFLKSDSISSATATGGDNRDQRHAVRTGSVLAALHSKPSPTSPSSSKSGQHPPHSHHPQHSQHSQHPYPHTGHFSATHFSATHFPYRFSFLSNSEFFDMHAASNDGRSVSTRFSSYDASEHTAGPYAPGTHAPPPIHAVSSYTTRENVLGRPLFGYGASGLAPPFAPPFAPPSASSPLSPLSAFSPTPHNPDAAPDSPSAWSASTGQKRFGFAGRSLSFLSGKARSSRVASEASYSHSPTHTHAQANGLPRQYQLQLQHQHQQQQPFFRADGHASTCDAYTPPHAHSRYPSFLWGEPYHAPHAVSHAVLHVPVSAGDAGSVGGTGVLKKPHCVPHWNGGKCYLGVQNGSTPEQQQQTDLAGDTSSQSSANDTQNTSIPTGDNILQPIVSGIELRSCSGTSGLRPQPLSDVIAVVSIRKDSKGDFLDVVEHVASDEAHQSPSTAPISPPPQQKQRRHQALLSADLTGSPTEDKPFFQTPANSHPLQDTSSPLIPPSVLPLSQSEIQYAYLHRLRGLVNLFCQSAPDGAPTEAAYNLLETLFQQQLTRQMVKENAMVDGARNSLSSENKTSDAHESPQLQHIGLLEQGLVGLLEHVSIPTFSTVSFVSNMSAAAGIVSAKNPGSNFAHPEQNLDRTHAVVNEPSVSNLGATLSTFHVVSPILPLHPLELSLLRTLIPHFSKDKEFSKVPAGIFSSSDLLWEASHEPAHSSTGSASSTTDSNTKQSSSSGQNTDTNASLNKKPSLFQEAWEAAARELATATQDPQMPTFIHRFLALFSDLNIPCPLPESATGSTTSTSSTSASQNNPPLPRSLLEQLSSSFPLTNGLNALPSEFWDSIKAQLAPPQRPTSRRKSTLGAIRKAVKSIRALTVPDAIKAPSSMSSPQAAGALAATSLTTTSLGTNPASDIAAPSLPSVSSALTTVESEIAASSADATQQPTATDSTAALTAPSAGVTVSPTFAPKRGDTGSPSNAVSRALFRDSVESLASPVLAAQSAMTEPLSPSSSLSFEAISATISATTLSATPFTTNVEKISTESTQGMPQTDLLTRQKTLLWLLFHPELETICRILDREASRALDANNTNASISPFSPAASPPGKSATSLWDTFEEESQRRRSTRLSMSSSRKLSVLSPKMAPPPGITPTNVSSSSATSSSEASIKETAASIARELESNDDDGNHNDPGSRRSRFTFSFFSRNSISKRQSRALPSSPLSPSQYLDGQNKSKGASDTLLSPSILNAPMLSSPQPSRLRQSFAFLSGGSGATSNRGGLNSAGEVSGATEQVSSTATGESVEEHGQKTCTSTLRLAFLQSLRQFVLHRCAYTTLFRPLCHCSENIRISDDPQQQDQREVSCVCSIVHALSASQEPPNLILDTSIHQTRTSPAETAAEALNDCSRSSKRALRKLLSTTVKPASLEVLEPKRLRVHSRHTTLPHHSHQQLGSSSSKRQRSKPSRVVTTTTTTTFNTQARAPSLDDSPLPLTPWEYSASLAHPYLPSVGSDSLLRVLAEYTVPSTQQQHMATIAAAATSTALPLGSNNGSGVVSCLQVPLLGFPLGLATCPHPLFIERRLEASRRKFHRLLGKRSAIAAASNALTNTNSPMPAPSSPSAASAFSVEDSASNSPTPISPISPTSKESSTFIDNTAVHYPNGLPLPLPLPLHPAFCEQLHQSITASTSASTSTYLSGDGTSAVHTQYASVSPISWSKGMPYFSADADVFTLPSNASNMFSASPITNSKLYVWIRVQSNASLPPSEAKPPAPTSLLSRKQPEPPIPDQPVLSLSLLPPASESNTPRSPQPQSQQSQASSSQSLATRIVFHRSSVTVPSDLSPRVCEEAVEFAIAIDQKASLGHFQKLKAYQDAKASQPTDPAVYRKTKGKNAASNALQLVPVEQYRGKDGKQSSALSYPVTMHPWERANAPLPTIAFSFEDSVVQTKGESLAMLCELWMFADGTIQFIPVFDASGEAKRVELNVQLYCTSNCAVGCSSLHHRIQAWKEKTVLAPSPRKQCETSQSPTPSAAMIAVASPQVKHDSTLPSAFFLHASNIVNATPSASTDLPSGSVDILVLNNKHDPFVLSVLPATLLAWGGDSLSGTTALSSFDSAMSSGVSGANGASSVSIPVLRTSQQSHRVSLHDLFSKVLLKPSVATPLAPVATLIPHGYTVAPPMTPVVNASSPLVFEETIIRVLPASTDNFAFLSELLMHYLEYCSHIPTYAPPVLKSKASATSLLSAMSGSAAHGSDITNARSNVHENNSNAQVIASGSASADGTQPSPGDFHSTATSASPAAVPSIPASKYVACTLYSGRVSKRGKINSAYKDRYLKLVAVYEMSWKPCAPKKVPIYSADHHRTSSMWESAIDTNTPNTPRDPHATTPATTKAAPGTNPLPLPDAAMASLPRLASSAQYSQKIRSQTFFGSLSSMLSPEPSSESLVGPNASDSMLRGMHSPSRDTNALSPSILRTDRSDTTLSTSISHTNDNTIANSNHTSDSLPYAQNPLSSFLVGAVDALPDYHPSYYPTESTVPRAAFLSSRDSTSSKHSTIASPSSKDSSKQSHSHYDDNPKTHTLFLSTLKQNAYFNALLSESDHRNLTLVPAPLPTYSAIKLLAHSFALLSYLHATCPPTSNSLDSPTAVAAFLHPPPNFRTRIVTRTPTVADAPDFPLPVPPLACTPPADQSPFLLASRVGVVQAAGAAEFASCLSAALSAIAQGNDGAQGAGGSGSVQTSVPVNYEPQLVLRAVRLEYWKRPSLLTTSDPLTSVSMELIPPATQKSVRSIAEIRGVISLWAAHASESNSGSNGGNGSAQAASLSPQSKSNSNLQLSSPSSARALAQTHSQLQGGTSIVTSGNATEKIPEARLMQLRFESGNSFWRHIGLPFLSVFPLYLSPPSSLAVPQFLQLSLGPFQSYLHASALIKTTGLGDCYVVHLSSGTKAPPNTEASSNTKGNKSSSTQSSSRPFFRLPFGRSNVSGKTTESLRKGSVAGAMKGAPTVSDAAGDKKPAADGDFNIPSSDEEDYDIVEAMPPSTVMPSTKPFLSTVSAGAKSALSTDNTLSGASATKTTLKSTWFPADPTKYTLELTTTSRKWYFAFGDSMAISHWLELLASFSQTRANVLLETLNQT